MRLTDAVRFDDRGLVACVVQDRLTGQVRMVGWMNREAIERTLATGLVTFFSRSRGTIWQKGETSGHVLRATAIAIDCDGDAILALVDPEGPTCHTGRPACFFRRADAGAGAGADLRDDDAGAAAFLDELDRAIDARRASTAERSYTKALLDGGAGRIGAKIEEEAAELARAVADESDDRVAAEAADVVYHVLVGLRSRGVAWRRVLEELGRRAGRGGHEEKAARKPASGPV